MSAFRRILVAVDGSACSDRALDEAIRLAAAAGGRLRLVHVMNQLAWFNGYESAQAYFDDVLPRMRAAGETLLAAGLAKALAAKVPAECELVVETPSRVCEVVREEALRWQADLVVAGTRGRSGIGRLLLGSDAEQIVRLAPVPVLLVRTPEGADEPRSPHG